MTRSSLNAPAGQTWLRRAAITAAAGFLGISGFQVALALGAPLGRAAWGGTQAELPTGLRIASAVAVGVWGLAAVIVLRRAGILAAPLPDGFVRRATWFLVGLLSLGAIMNLASPSGWERFGWGPATLVLTGLCVVIARARER